MKEDYALIKNHVIFVFETPRACYFETAILTSKKNMIQDMSRVQR